MLYISVGELQFRMELDEIQRYVMSYVLKARSMPYSGVSLSETIAIRSHSLGVTNPGFDA